MFLKYIAFVIIVIVIIINNCNGNEEIKFEIDKKIQDRINNGKIGLELIKKNSITNRCFEDCMDILSKGCDGMNDLEKSRLAVRLTNCHLSKSGKQIYQCNFDMSIEECTNPMDQLSFATYTNFYISTENICYYLSQELFQSKTEKTINNLISSTQETKNLVNSISNKANDMMESIDNSIQGQKKLMVNQKSILDIMDTSIKSINDIESTSQSIELLINKQSEKQQMLVDSQNLLFEKYKIQSKQSLELIDEIKQTSNTLNDQQKQTLDKQNYLIKLQSQSIEFIETISKITDVSLLKLKQLSLDHDKLIDGNKVVITILNQLNSIQNWILMEVVDFKSIYYYISVFFSIILVSSTIRTKSSRIPLLIFFFISIGVERSIGLSVFKNSILLNLIFKVLNYFPSINFIWNNLNNNQDPITTSLSYSKEFIYYMINSVRILFLVVSFSILLVSLWFYRDYERENHQLLENILQSVNNSNSKYRNLKKLLIEKGILDKNDKSLKSLKGDYTPIKINDE